MSFEANAGQTDRRANFVARGSGFSLFLTNQGAVLALQGTEGASPRHSQLRQAAGQSKTVREAGRRRPNVALSMRLLGSSPDTRAVGLDELPGKANYFTGRNPSKWHTQIPAYAKVKYEGVYPGVDLVYYGRQGQLENDFVVAPGGRPESIELEFDGAREIVLDKESGDLIVGVSGGDVRFHRPVIYQPAVDVSGLGAGEPMPATLLPKPIKASRTRVEGHYELRGPKHVGFTVSSYDRNLPLIIDPTLAYSTYLGGSGQESPPVAIAVDSSGNAYVTGTTASTDFPTTSGAYQTACDTSAGSCSDAFVAKLNPTGTTLAYASYLGGSGTDLSLRIALDSAGNAYLTGKTASTDFPTANAFQATYQGGADDAFVSEISADGSKLLYSTYLGGNGGDTGFGIAVSGSLVYLAGQTLSTNFPLTSTAFQGKCGTDGTCNGGLSDSFVTVLDLSKAGSAQLVYSTYYGGSNLDFANGVATDSKGFVYVAGLTQSTDLATTANCYQPKCGTDGTCNGSQPDAFVAKFNPSASGTASLVYATYLGGSASDSAGAIALDSAANVYLSGSTNSSDFPVTPGVIQGTFGGGNCKGSGGATVPCPDAFVAKLAPNSAGKKDLVYSTYLGGTGTDVGNSIAVEPGSGVATAIGFTNSAKFPTAGSVPGVTNSLNLGQPAMCGSDACSDVFLAKIDASGTGLLLSTYLGGTNSDGGYGVAVDSSGNAYAAGTTSSIDFPTAAGISPNTYHGGGDAFVANFSQFTFPFLVLSTNSLNFGNQNVGVSTATPLTVTVNSTGDANLAIGAGSITVSGANASDFTATDNNTCTGAPIPPTGTCTISVTFKPSVSGTETATVSVASNASGSPAKFTVTGVGVPVVSLTPGTLPPFGNQIIGSTGSQTVTLNTNGALSITSFALSGANSGDFAVPSPPSSCSAPSCTFTVNFTPTAAGARAATLTISEGGSPASLVLALSGTGSDFSLAATPGSNSINSGQSATYTLSVSPVGGFNQAVSLTCAGAPAGSNCSISPSSVTLSGSSAVNATVTVTTASGTTPAGTSTLTFSGAAGSLKHTTTVGLTVKDFSIAVAAGSPTTKTVSAGSSASYNLVLDPLKVFDETVNLTCSVSPQLTRPPTCTPSPASTTLNPASRTSVTLTASTTAPSMVVPWSGQRWPAPPSRLRISSPWLLCLVLLLMMAGLGIARRTRGRTSLGAAAGIIFAAVALTSAACGGGGGGGGGTPGTSSGTYTITVTATGGNLTHTTTVTLVVQ